MTESHFHGVQRPTLDSSSLGCKVMNIQAVRGVSPVTAREGHLPTELLVAIFDYVEEAFTESHETYDPSVQGTRIYTANELALKQCFAAFALVCRHWLAVAQPYLNRTYAVSFSMHAGDYDSFGSLMSWLDSNPTVPNAVQHLRLLMSRCFHQEDFVPQGGFHYTILCHLLHRFSGLRKLDLVDVRFTDEALEDQLEGLQSPLLDLTHIGIYHTAVSAPIATDVARILSWLGNAGEVYLSTHPELDWIPGNAIPVIPWHLRTQSLMIKSLDLPIRLIRRLCDSQTFKEGVLRKLHVQIDVFSIPNLLLLLQPAAPSVTELSLDFSLYSIRTTQIFTLLLNNSFPIGDFHHLQRLDLVFPLPSVYQAGVHWNILSVIDAQLHDLTRLESFSITVVDDEQYADEDVETRLDTCCEFLLPPLTNIADALMMSHAPLKLFDVVFRHHSGRRLAFMSNHIHRISFALLPIQGRGIHFTHMDSYP